MPVRSLRPLLPLALLAVLTPAQAARIVLSNDDGLTSNVIALHDALVAAGHDVIVSVPCTGQSGMGAAAKFFQPLTPLTAACLNNAAQAGDPGAGPVTKAGLGEDYFYVNGTPVMATLYGLDVAAQARWGGAPDIVLSGPNEGQNVGSVTINSGTVSNAQQALSRGLPSIALSAVSNTAGSKDEAGNIAANPLSAEVASLSVHLLDTLSKAAGPRALLPPGVALNVNFPDFEAGGSAELDWAFARFGSYDAFTLIFVDDLAEDPVAQAYGLGDAHYPGLSIDPNEAAPTMAQQHDEAVVYRSAIAVTAMQFGYEQSAAGQAWAQWYLRGLFGEQP